MTTKARPSTTTTTEEDTPADAIEVTALDYAYEDLPSEIHSGTALALRNSSAAELHELVALRLPDDETRSGLLLMADASLLCGDQPQALAAYRQALMRANQQSHVLRAADAIDGLAHLIPSGDDRRLALTAAAELRRASGGTRRLRPWLPSLDSPRSRDRAGRTPAQWMNGRRLSDVGVSAIIASATAALHVGRPASVDSIARLSPAERRVAELVSDGLSNREIGEQLHIARRTVETHIVHAFQKLGVQNRTQLARLVAK